MKHAAEEPISSRMISELRSEILSGKYNARERFLSEAQIMRRYGVARQTAVRVLDRLVRDGLVYRRKGSGTFITDSARNRTGAIGIIVPGLAYAEIFAPVCSALSRLCAEKGYTLQLADFSSDDPVERAKLALGIAEDLASRNVAGVVFQPIEFLADSDDINERIVSRLDEANIPVVLMDGDLVSPPRRSRYDIVAVDNFAGGYAVGRHLVSQGVRRMCFLMREHWALSVQERLHGVMVACAEAGVPFLKSSVFHSEPTDARKVAALMRSKNRPEAIMCGNDTAALHLKMTLSKLGYEVPRDVLLAGFDDVQHAKIASLTTCRQPLEKIASSCLEMLISRMEHPDGEPREIRLHADFVRRESTDFRQLCTNRKGTSRR